MNGVNDGCGWWLMMVLLAMAMLMPWRLVGLTMFSFFSSTAHSAQCLVMDALHSASCGPSCPSFSSPSPH